MDERAQIGAPPEPAGLRLDPACPACGYNLRGLPEPRCPECGEEFAWDNVIAGAERQRACPLFEYQWHRRPLRSFVGTLARALLPPWLWVGRWRAVPPRRGPLLALVLLVLLVYALSLLVAEHAVFELSRYRQFGSGGLVWIGPLAATGPMDYAWPLVSYAVIGAGLWIVLRLLCQTLPRSPVPRDRLLRIVVLSWAALVGWRALTLWLLVAGELIALRRSSNPEWTAQTHEVLPLLALLVSLCSGLTFYLKLRRGWLLGIIACALVLVVLPLLLLALSIPWLDYWSKAASASWPGTWRTMMLKLLGGIWG